MSQEVHNNTTESGKE